jgi:hypothetical protein
MTVENDIEKALEAVAEIAADAVERAKPKA